MPDLRRILVLNRTHIGDCLLTTPLLRALKRGFPYAELCVSIPDSNRDLLSTNPHVDRLIYRPNRSHWAAKIAFALELRRERFDLIIALQEKSVFYAWTTWGACFLNPSAPRTIALEDPRTRRFYDKHCPIRPDQHEVYKYLSIAELLGCPVDANPVLELEPTSAARGRIDTLLRNAGYDRETRFLALNPGGTKPGKRWPEERFAEVGNRLQQELGLPMVVLGGSDDRERAEGIAASMARPPLVVAGDLSLGDTAAMLERCSLLVTGDTGPMHMAVALAAPVVALFGPTNPRKYGPFTTHTTILRHERPCAQCREERALRAEGARRRGIRDQARCPDDRDPCLHTISVEECLDAALRLYDAPQRVRVPSQDGNPVPG